ncbi:MAG: hypothetical protein B6D61_00540 [Bacteroidetes bacterium 4484_249]|nr:MAG: hypothetical protein B6D61_00540 [Bacteroidetes bacterium 4484_249]RLD74500.1 MAG: glycosyl transferase [Bacteroidota bacterium]
MKVFQINTTLNSGSTGRIAEGIGQKVIENGGESYIAFGRSSNPSSSSAIKIGTSWDQTLHLAHTRLFDTHGFHSKKATDELVQNITKIQPDIIHLHNIHGYYLNIEILFDFFKDWSKPIVWTFHDCWPFTGHCCYYERVKCEKWKTGCHHCPLKKLYPRSCFLDNSRSNYLKKKFLFNLPDNLHLVTVSHWLENQVKESFFQSHRLQTIYNGVDLTVFKPGDQNVLKKRYGYENKKIILGVANIWSEGKGLKSFLELSKLINEKQLIILIGVNEKLSKKLPENVIGIKHTSSIEELAAYYNMADVFVSPSIAETFGVVIAEAMACGTPSVVYNSSAMTELVDKEIGYVVPVNNYDLLFIKINDVLNKTKTYYSISCRKRAEKYFNQNQQFENYIKLYKSILEN